MVTPTEIHHPIRPRTSSWRPDRVLELSTTQQISAATGLTRSKLLVILADGQACVSELADMLSMPRGTVAYHLRVLEEAGLVYVASTRRVRAVTKRYYARVARRFVIEHRSASGGSAMAAVREFLAEYGGDVRSATECAPSIRRLSMPLDRATEFIDRLDQLTAEFAAAQPGDAGSRPVGVIAGAFWLTGRDPSAEGATQWPAPCSEI